MLLTSRIQSVGLIVGENTRMGPPQWQHRYSFVFLYLSTFLLKLTALPVVRHRSPYCLLSERDIGRPSDNVCHKNAREERGLPGLDG